MEPALQIPLLTLFFTAAVSENVALYYFLGICPLISISADLKASFNMGLTVSMVMLITTAANWAVYNLLLRPLALEYLQLLFFVSIIAAVVQLLEQFLDRFFPSIYEVFGIFLPLITVNCAILGVAMFAVLREYSLVQSLVFAAGSGIGWWLVICIIASVRRRIDLTAVPVHLGKTGITMLIAAVIALAFSGITELMSGGL
ncbi:MAG: NADH:ubiquinone reductase (Na(+)-transporting) subunit E [Candidatus Riflebacteria bacterium HGW-Riflebacteria-1]|jgi:Na+-transporting NADH:ubiquinone oxidoreductase subunit E|nr:MAG: NADH:ubiquinone reductase (Na(+)-transporting) subunit E [Candidatus Riflebacteria bacterium HGW-Riflebacteria-1]